MRIARQLFTGACAFAILTAAFAVLSSYVKVGRAAAPAGNEFTYIRTKIEIFRSEKDSTGVTIGLCEDAVNGFVHVGNIRDDMAAAEAKLNREQTGTLSDAQREWGETAARCSQDPALRSALSEDAAEVADKAKMYMELTR
jgi:hypothetical protein